MDLTKKMLSVSVAVMRRETVSPLNIFYKIQDEAVCLELIKTGSGIRLLTENTQANGWSALHQAVLRHESLALELIKTRKGIRLLARTKDLEGLNAFTVAIQHPRVYTEFERMYPGSRPRGDRAIGERAREAARRNGSLLRQPAPRQARRMAGA